MDISEIQSEVMELKETLDTNTILWRKLVMQGLVGHEEASAEIEKLSKLNRKREQELSEALHQEDITEAISIIESILQIHDTLSYREVEDRVKRKAEEGKIDKEKAAEIKQAIEDSEAAVESISKSTLADLKCRANDLPGAMNRPEIIFRKEVLLNLQDKAIESKRRGLEYGALLNYRRLEEGLLITDFEEYEELNLEENRSDTSLSLTENIKKKLSKTPEEKKILFHTHPSVDNGSNRKILELSSKDKIIRGNFDQGILVVATIGSEFGLDLSDSSLNVCCWAVTAVKRSEDKKIFNEYLPLKVSEDGKDITESIPLLKAYNQNIPKSANRGKNPYKFLGI